MTHTDAIEETEEPVKQIKVDVVEEEPAVAKIYEKFEKVECEPEEPKQVESKTPDEETTTLQGNTLHITFKTKSKWYP